MEDKLKKYNMNESEIDPLNQYNDKLQTIDRILDNNQFNGTLTMGDTISEQLQVVNFRDNLLSSFTVTSKYNKSLM